MRQKRFSGKGLEGESDIEPSADEEVRTRHEKTVLNAQKRTRQLRRSLRIENIDTGLLTS